MVLLVDATANPLTIAAQANGNIKKYQIIVGTILLLIVPIAYFALKLGYQPEIVFGVHLIIVLIAQCARLIMIKGMISLAVKEYIKKVVLRIVAVVCSSVILPLSLHIYLSDGFLYMISICFISCISVLISVYTLGLSGVERQKIHGKINNYIHRKNEN